MQGPSKQNQSKVKHEGKHRAFGTNGDSPGQSKCCMLGHGPQMGGTSMMVSLEVTEKRMYSHARILTYRVCLSAPASPRWQIIYQSQPRYLPKQEQCLSRAEDKALSILRRRIHTMQRVLYNQPAAARNGKISGSTFFPTLLLPDVIVYTLWLRFSALLTQPACWGVYLNPDSYRKRHPQHGTRMNNLASTLCPPSEVCRVSLATSGILPLPAHATSAFACAIAKGRI